MVQNILDGPGTNVLICISTRLRNLFQRSPGLLSILLVAFKFSCNRFELRVKCFLRLLRFVSFIIYQLTCHQYFLLKKYLPCNQQ